MTFKSKASLTEALPRASDLEDEVWHPWLEWGLGSDASQSSGGSAAAGSKMQMSLDLGSMRLIVDAGCRHNLIAEM